MKPLLSFLFLLCITTAAVAQSSWKVVHNGKQKLATTTEDPEKNIISVKRSDLKKNGYLWVTYTDKEQQKDWKRIIALFDAKDAELLKHGGHLLKVGNPKLNALANKVKEIHIYTWSLPTDPEVAATVRVRRIHLCTIRIING